jgi:hypothetical protein
MHLHVAGKQHAIARFRIGVALLTLQAEGQVLLMAIGNGLRRRLGDGRWTIFTLRGRRRHGRLLPQNATHRNRSEKRQKQNENCGARFHRQAQIF